MPAALICVHFNMLYFSLILWDSVYSLVGFSLFGNTKERMLTVVLFATVRCILNSYWTASSSPPSSSKSNNLTKKMQKHINYLRYIEILNHTQSFHRLHASKYQKGIFKIWKNCKTKSIVCVLKGVFYNLSILFEQKRTVFNNFAYQ